MSIAFVQVGGLNASKSVASSLAATVPAAGHAVGDLVLVAWMINGGGSTNTFSATDTRNNQWNTVFNGVTASSMQTWVFGSIVTTRLQSGDTITVSGTTTSIQGIICVEFSGTSLNNDVAGATSSATTATPSASITPKSPVTLTFGALGINGPTGDAFTEATGNAGGDLWHTTASTGTSGGVATSNISCHVAYKITSSAAAQSYNPTITSRLCCDTIVSLDLGPTASFLAPAATVISAS